jgi:hypothetical protein
MNKTNKNRRQAGKGFALLMVMIMVVVAVVLGVSYLSIASIKLQSAVNYVNCSSAKSLAESGLEHGMYILQNSPDSIVSSSQGNPLGPYYVDGSSDHYVIYGVNNSAGHYTITAEGSVGGVTQKASATATRSGGPSIVMTRAGTLNRALVKLPATLTVNGGFHVNGKLVNYARIAGSASATLGVQDTGNKIDTIVTAGTQDVPTMTVANYKNYNLLGSTYSATTLAAASVISASNSLANGGAITTSNPAGVVALTPYLGSTTLPDNFKFKGTLVTTGNLILDGANIELTATDGFPAIVCNGNIVITSKTRVTINGTVLINNGGQIVSSTSGSGGATSVINGCITGNTPGYDVNLAGAGHVLSFDAGRSKLYDVTGNSNSAITVSFDNWIR